MTFDELEQGLNAIAISFRAHNREEIQRYAVIFMTGVHFALDKEEKAAEAAALFNIPLDQRKASVQKVLRLFEGA